MNRDVIQTDNNKNTLVLDNGRTAVWKIALQSESELSSCHSQHLSSSELQLASRLKQTRKRQQFIVTRSILRQLIARYLEISTENIEIERNPHGKPFCSGIEFNISHSRDWALIALARDRQVGVDVQHMKHRLDFERIARRRFTPEEQAQICSEQNPISRRNSFFAIWTRKEAYVKAHGTTFYDKISSLNLPLGRDEIDDPKLGGSWELKSYKIGSDYWATVCSANPLGQINMFDWQQDFKSVDSTCQ